MVKKESEMIETYRETKQITLTFNSHQEAINVRNGLILLLRESMNTEDVYLSTGDLDKMALIMDLNTAINLVFGE